jgi:hypothetical protein
MHKAPGNTPGLFLSIHSFKRDFFTLMYGSPKRIDKLIECRFLVNYRNKKYKILP